MKAFLSYSRHDSEWVRGAGLKDITAPPMMEWIKEQLANTGDELWIDTRLEERVGADFEEDIRARLMQADLAIVLVSQDYITSKFIAEKEMTIIRERVDKGEMKIFPIIVSTVIWEHNDMARWISKRQLYPSRTQTLQHEISSLRDMKMHRTEILRLITNLMTGRSTGTSVRTTAEKPASNPVNQAAAGEPATAPPPKQKPWLIPAAMVLVLLIAAAGYFLRPKNTPPPIPINLTTPVLREESKNLDIPPAIYGSRVVLEWTAFSVPDTDMFEVDVSKSQSFSESDTFVKQTSSDSLILERAQDNSKLLGRLYWRVRISRTRGTEVSKGPWSDVGAFEIYDNALSRIVLSQRLVVGTSALQNLPGDTIRKRGAGDYEGLDADVVAQLVASLRTKLGTPNLTAQFVNMPWKDLLPVLSRNQVDIAISGMSATQVREREYNVKFSRPYYSTAQVCMALKSSGVFSLADALKRKAYSIEGRAGNRVAQAIFSNNEIAPGAAHYDKLFEVLRDHPDAVAIHDYAMLYSQAIGTGTADQYVFFPIESSDLPEEKRKAFLDAHNGEDCDRWAIAVAASQSELLNEINGCLDLLDGDGKLSQLIVHHNYPESSLQNCQITLANIPDPGERPSDAKPAPKPSSTPTTTIPAAKPPANGQVETVPF